MVCNFEVRFMCRRGWNVPRPRRWKVHVVLVKHQRKGMEANVIPAACVVDRLDTRDGISPESCPASTGSAFDHPFSSEVEQQWYTSHPKSSSNTCILYNQKLLAIMSSVHMCNATPYQTRGLSTPVGPCNSTASKM